MSNQTAKTDTIAALDALFDACSFAREAVQGAQELTPGHRLALVHEINRLQFGLVPQIKSAQLAADAFEAIRAQVSTVAF
jgi:hypothetical protein